MNEFFATLITIMLLEPLQADLEQARRAAQAPAAVVQPLSACARNAAPVLLDRAATDPWWAGTNALRLWAGWTTPEAVLAQAAPQCRSAVEAARPFLQG